MRRRGRRRLRGALAAGVVILCAAGHAGALTDEEIYRQFHLSFVPVGARALAMGGAYVALADDASAAEANPAGLASLKASQLYLEYGSLRNDALTSRSSQGNLDVNPVTGDRTLPFLSLTSASEPDTAGVPSLVGFSWPFAYGGDRRRLVVGGSRQVVHSQDLTLPAGSQAAQARFSFDTFPNTVSGGQVVAYSVGAPVSGRLSSEIVYWNAVAAAEVHPDFSVGVSVGYATLDLEAETLTQVVDPLQILVDSSHPRLPVQPSTDVYRTEADGTDEDVVWGIGVLWHPETAFSRGRGPWRFGASFRKGAQFGVEERTFLNGQPDRRFENGFAVPDQYGIGAAYRLLDRWLLSGEIERVEFADLLEGFRDGVNYLTSPQLAAGAFATGAGPVRFKVGDGTVYRLGVEYARPLGGRKDLALALRGGWFRTPDMQPRMQRFNSTDRDVNRTYRDAFPGGDAESHFTLGAGLDWGASSFLAAVETSDAGERILATYALGFGTRPQ